MSVPPLKRIVEQGQRGRDVAGFKRELHYARVEAPGFVWRHNPYYGAGMVSAVKHFQAAHRLTADGVIGPITHTHLWKYGDAYAHWLITNVRTPAPNPRKRLVAELGYLLRVHGEIGYSEERPIPLKRILHHQWPVRTDCSGLITAAFYAAGFPDPNGLHYSGEGYTGTMMTHLTPIASWMRKPGDLIIFGYYPGLHVVALLETTSSDPLVFSHGHPGLPDDPSTYPLSRFIDYFSGQPVQYYSCL